MTNHEINLNRLCLWELLRHKDTYGQFKSDIIALLMPKDLYDFEDDLLARFKAKSMDQLISSHPDQFIRIGKRVKAEKNKWVDAWYDTAKDYVITPDVPTYGLFLVYWLRNLEIDQIDEFLRFQFHTHFERDSLLFRRTIHLAIRRHGKMMRNEQIETVGEWLSGLDKPVEGETAKLIKIQGSEKGRMKRGAAHKPTVLTQEQTALLIFFMQESRIILKDEYLHKTEAGHAFAVLTGFSPETLRHDLGKFRDIENITKKNLSELHTVLKQLIHLVEHTISLKKD